MNAPGVIDVTADFTGLNVAPELVYLTNEQGATSFTHYRESDGASRELIDAPGTPDQWIPSNAAETCLESPARGIRFCLETAPGEQKYVDRERYFQRRWSGLVGAVLAVVGRLGHRAVAADRGLSLPPTGRADASEETALPPVNRRRFNPWREPAA